VNGNGGLDGLVVTYIQRGLKRRTKCDLKRLAKKVRVLDTSGFLEGR
jgi:hypothetical protein